VGCAGPRLNRDVAINVSAVRFSERFELLANVISAPNHPNARRPYDNENEYCGGGFAEVLGNAPTHVPRLKATACTWTVTSRDKDPASANSARLKAC